MTGELLLIAASFFTSAMTAVLGLGGGILLIAIMANILPPLAVVPVHGIVQLASNSSRALFSRSEIIWRLIPSFCAGVVLGSLGAFPLLKVVKPEYLPLPLALFILFLTWMPKNRKGYRIPGAMVVLGAMQGFLTLFAGATGALNTPFLIREKLSGGEVVATHAIIMTIVHVVKIGIFGLLGFVFSDYLALLIWMVAAVVLGSFVGTVFRRRVADDKLKVVLKIAVTLLALRMIWKSFI